MAEQGGGTRRDFIVGAVVGAAAGAGTMAVLRPGSDTAPSVAPPTPASLDSAVTPTTSEGAKEALTAADLAGAEKVAGIAYTEEERTQLLASFDAHLERIKALRAVVKPNELAPATVFDPRLPGRTYAPQENGVRTVGEVPSDPPADPADLAYAPATHLSAWLQAGKVTSVQLTELYLERIGQLGPKLECFVTVTADLARAQAAAADAERAAGRVRGPLHGVPYVLKDLADTAGIATTWGAVAFKDRVATGDAVVTTRLREAGAVLLGKTTLGELAYGDIWFGGITRNPWNAAEGSSGSSAGTASAVAAGLAGFGIGTETLGSIVSPSQRCGTTGLRPTFGRVARTGCMALCWSLDKLGPITRSVEDTALVLAAINGSDAGDASSLDHGFAYDGGQGLEGLRIGYSPSWFDGQGATEVDRAALKTLKGLGATLVEIALPELPIGTTLTILEAEAAAAFEELTLTDKDAEMRWQANVAWPNTWRRARFLSAVDLVQADRVRRMAMVAMDGVFQQVDLLFGPNFAGGLLLTTNMSGHPQLSLRAGFRELATRPTAFDSPNDDPNAPKFRVTHNVSLWAPLFQEGRLVAAGRVLEQALGVWRERPPVG